MRYVDEFDPASFQQPACDRLREESGKDIRKVIAQYRTRPATRPSLNLGSRAPTEENSVCNTSSDLLFICSASDVPAGSATRAEAGEFVLAVFNLDGTIFVIDDACTHGPGSLSEGYIEDDIVECNFHRGAFNIRTGAVVSPPCTVPVRTYAVVISQGAVYIDPNRPRSS